MAFRQHINTPRFAKDAATKLYVDTVFNQVKPGASSSVFDYRYDGTSTGESDPGAGRYRYSSSPQSSATQLYMDWITQDGFDVVALFTKMKFGDTFIIQDKDFSLSYQQWRLLGPAIIEPDWFRVPVQFIEGEAEFTHNQLVSFVVTFVGQEGEVGPMGPQGPSGPQGIQGEPGIDGEDGIDGENGVGVPTGGTANQVLAKIDNTDYNTQWVVQSGGASQGYVDTQDALRVLKAGDTMTGALMINSTEPWVTVGGPADSGIWGYRGNPTVDANIRWGVNLAQGANADFKIERFTSAGVFVDYPLQINRTTGAATFAGNLVVKKEWGGITVDAAATSQAIVAWSENDAPRWVIYKYQDAAGDLEFGRYNDAGVYAGRVMSFSRATGLGVVSADPTAALGIATKQYVDSKVVSGAYLPLAGGTMSGRIGQHSTGFRVAGINAINTRIDSGFYENNAGTLAEGWFIGGGWHNLIACTHSNDSNYYSMQLGMSFASSDQRLYFRNSDGAGGTAWRYAWDSVSVNGPGSVYCLDFKYSTPGSGGWYDAGGVARRFFVGSEGTSDLWRIYSQGGGNIVTFHGYDSTVSFAGTVQVAATLDCAGSVWAKSTVLYLGSGGHYISWSENYYYHFPHGNLHSQGKWVARNGDDVSFANCSASTAFHSNGNHYYMAGDGVWQRWRGDLGRVEFSHGLQLTYIEASDMYLYGGLNLHAFTMRSNSISLGDVCTFGDASHGSWNHPRVVQTTNGVNGSWTSGYNLISISGRRYKKDIKSLESIDARKVLELRPISFKANTEICRLDDPDDEHLGFIAEEVAEIEPRLVQFEFPREDVIEHPREGLSKPRYREGSKKVANYVEYDRISVLLVMLAKQHEERIKQLEGKLDGNVSV